MSADLSRVRFDPLRDHSGIGIQQGRLWLDADFNEQVAITDRRLRAQTVDLSPSPTVVSRRTPDAFLIGLSGGKLAIGPGRMYVDGLLAENHGTAMGFDPVLAELNGTGPVEYAKQPYWPSPAPLPEGGRHLVYLDVWERELTHLNTPDLVDSAIGVDTTTRTQTVWQVRLLPVAGDVACGSSLKAWDDLVAPSAARLSTGTIAVDPVDDPCEIPPGTGYRGPENQLYRVELHSPTQFKWSRDNASVGSVVVEVVSATSLRLQSLGRDEVLCVKDGDWVEITDDARELAQESGEMRQVTVDVATSTITFSPALPVELTSTTHHLRVRKWDSGLIPVPGAGAPVSLEHGITVSFGSGKGRAGDHWMFAARATAATPEESLEKLVSAPPRGTHHHYARLALITLSADGGESLAGSAARAVRRDSPLSASVTDCRPDWPVAEGGGCGCEICVTPEQHNDGTFTIQDAIERASKLSGGTITLCPGTYELDRPLELARVRSIRIRGCGQASRLVGKQAAIKVTLSQDIVLEDFSVAGGWIGLDGANRSVRLERLWISQPKQTAIGLAGAQELVWIRGCLISAHAGVTGEGLLTTGLSIEDNTFVCENRGIDLSIERGQVLQHAGHTSIRGNTLSGCSDAGIVVTGLIPEDASLDICGNTLEVNGSGVIVGGRARLCDNTLIGSTRVAGKDGIALTASPPDATDGVAHVTGNNITGFGGAGISVSADMLSLIVKQNVIRGTAGGILVQSAGGGKTAAIDNNQIFDLRQAVPANDEPTVSLRAAAAARVSYLAGIVVVGVGHVTVLGNVIDGISSEARQCFGIGLATFVEGRIVGNTVNRVASEGGNATGIIVATWQNSVSVVDNSVLAGGVARPGWIALNLFTGASSPGAASAGMVRMAAATAGTWSFVGAKAFLQRDTLGHVELTGNTLQGGGEAVAVGIATNGDVVMNSNRCSQPGGGEQTVVRVRAGVAVVQGNRVHGGRPSMTMDVDAGSAVVLGNISSGGIHLGGTPIENLGKPWSPLNPIA